MYVGTYYDYYADEVYNTASFSYRECINDLIEIFETKFPSENADYRKEDLEEYGYCIRHDGTGTLLYMMSITEVEV